MFFRRENKSPVQKEKKEAPVLVPHQIPTSGLDFRAFLSNQFPCLKLIKAWLFLHDSFTTKLGLLRDPHKPVGILVAVVALLRSPTQCIAVTALLRSTKQCIAVTALLRSTKQCIAVTALLRSTKQCIAVTALQRSTTQCIAVTACWGLPHNV